MRVRLLKEHTHGGLKLPAGTELDVIERRADFMVEHGVAERLQAGRIVVAGSLPSKKTAKSLRCCGWK